MPVLRVLACAEVESGGMVPAARPVLIPRPTRHAPSAHRQHHGLTADAPRQNDPIGAPQPTIADQVPAAQAATRALLACTASCPVWPDQGAMGASHSEEKVYGFDSVTGLQLSEVSEPTASNL